MRKPLPLKFEELPFHPFHKGQGVNYASDIRRIFNWLKKNWRKEFFVSLVFLLALLPEPHQVKAVAVPVPPTYIQPVPRLEPVVAVSFPAPTEVSPVVIPEPPASPVAVPVAPPVPVGACTIVHTGDTYKDYIFSVESGGNTCSTNPGGCYGLGQDCNNWLANGRLNSPACPNWRYDVSCQLAYWDWYANTIYGGWANAYAFRTTHKYW